MGKVSDKLAASKKEGGTCWLMKTEPEVYSIDDLKKEKKCLWDGVRNFQARNFMRYEMQPGDKVLFYHSNSDPSGVVGIAKVLKTAQVDPEQFNKKSKYYDATSREEKPKWYCCEVGFEKKLPRLVALGEIRENAKLAKMLVIQRGMRLSVQPVLASEFEEILAMAEKAPPSE